MPFSEICTIVSTGQIYLALSHVKESSAMQDLIVNETGNAK